MFLKKNHYNNQCTELFDATFTLVIQWRFRLHGCMLKDHAGYLAQHSAGKGITFHGICILL